MILAPGKINFGRAQCDSGPDGFLAEKSFMFEIAADEGSSPFLFLLKKLEFDETIF